MEGDKEGLQSMVDSKCPICKRPLDDKKPGEKKSRFAEYGWIVALLIVVIVIVAILAAVLISDLSSLGTTGEPESYYSEVIISEGGHFKYDLGWAYSDVFQVKLNISSKNGDRFDVYIMDENGYINAYQPFNESIISFSAYYSEENATDAVATINLPINRYYYVVIDNRDTALTPDDATPTGSINVNVYLEFKSQYYLD